MLEKLHAEIASILPSAQVASSPEPEESPPREINADTDKDTADKTTSDPGTTPDNKENKTKHSKSLSFSSPLNAVKKRVSLPWTKSDTDESSDGAPRTDGDYDEDEDEDETDIVAQPSGIAQSIFSIFAANSKSKAAVLDEFENDVDGDDDEDTPVAAHDKSKIKPYVDKLHAISKNIEGEVVLATKLTQDLRLDIDLPHSDISDAEPEITKEKKEIVDSEEEEKEPKLPPLSERSKKLRKLVSFLNEKLTEVETTNQTMLTNKTYKDKIEEADRNQAVEDRIRELIDLDDDDQLVADYTCWLWRNILLQGYFYITKKKLCFFSYLPRKDTGAVIHSGSLSKKARKSSLYNRFWCVLKNDSFSYFNSSIDLYFPEGIIDLRYALNASLEPVEGNNSSSSTAEKPTSFVIMCEDKNYYFKADTHAVAAGWVKAIQKEIFRSHNEGDRVKIIIPYENIIDVERSQVFEFAETFKFKVIESDETYALDEYLFSFFKNGNLVMKIVHAIMSSKNLVLDDSFGEQPLDEDDRSRSLRKIYDSTRDFSVSPVRDKENNRRLSPLNPLKITKRKTTVNFGDDEKVETTPLECKPLLETSELLRKVISEPIKRTSSFTSLKRILPGNLTLPGSRHRTTSSPPPVSKSLKARSRERYNSKSASDVEIATEDKDTSAVEDTIEFYSDDNLYLSSPIVEESRPSTPRVDSPLPSPKVDSPLPSSPKVDNTLSSSPSNDRSWADYAKQIGKVPFKLPVIHKVTEMWVGGARHFDSEEDEPNFGSSLSEKTLSTEDKNIGNQRFRDHFALGDSESLRATYFCHLYRGIPTYGKIYVSRNYLCFRSLLPGTKTKMILPLRDIENVTKENGFKFGYSGLVIVIHGHEEVFFEFSSGNDRDDCEMVCLRYVDELNKLPPSTLPDSNRAMLSCNMAKLCSFEDALKNEMTVDIPPVMISNELTESVQNFAIPIRKYHFTLLTIGSRGDVQPYIALGKKLLSEGHKVRIATHSEFQPWIQKHGIEFAEVAGDPSELMKIMVDHGMFSVAFLREAASKFRTWIDQLLITSWEACQGTDIIIESPSAMGGIHIAEALNVPYFRAFTMPWSRTRAYPHSFIVPDQKMGGSYNYLTYVMFDNVFWKGIAGQVNRWRKKTLKLLPTNLELMQQNKVPFLYSVSPSVLPPPLDFSDWVTVTGYWFLDEGNKDYEPPADLMEFMTQARRDGKKLVYIGFGSIVVSNPKELTKAVIESVLKADVRCVLSKGWSDRLGKKKANEVEVELPPEVFQIQSAPHDWLFPQMDAAVHHGGSGSTGASLRAGLPTIIKPFFGDQFFYANRVEDLGAGIYLKKLNVKQFSRALWQATHNDRILARAADIGTHIRAENGTRKAINMIYRDLEYAKSLVEAKQARNKRKPVGDAIDPRKYAIHQVDDDDESHDETSTGYSSIDGQWSHDSWMIVDHEL